MRPEIQVTARLTEVSAKTWRLLRQFLPWIGAALVLVAVGGQNIRHQWGNPYSGRGL